MVDKLGKAVLSRGESKYLGWNYCHLLKAFQVICMTGAKGEGERVQCPEVGGKELGRPHESDGMA